MSAGLMAGHLVVQHRLGSLGASGGSAWQAARRPVVRCRLTRHQAAGPPQRRHHQLSIACVAQGLPNQPIGGNKVSGSAAAATSAGAAASASSPVVVSAAAAARAAAVAAPPAPPAAPLPPPASPTTDVSGPSGSPNGTAPEKEEPEFALLLVACGIGLATGAAIVAFNVAVHEIRDFIWEGQPLLTGSRILLRNIAESELWPKVVFPPLLGGLAVGTLGWAVGGYDEPPALKVGGASQQQQKAGGSSSSGGGAAESASSSTSAAMESWKLQLAAVMRPVSRAVAAAITLGTGASLGPEGPSVDIGKSVAKGMGSSLKSKQRHLTSLLAAGSGAGVAAGFNAPVAGVFFAVETVLQRQKLPRPSSTGDLQQQQQELREAVKSLSPSATTIAMVLLASVLAAIVSQAGLGSSPAFRVPEYRLESMVELPLYLIFGAVCGVVSASFSFSTRVATDAFDELRQQNAVEAALMPCIGGLTTGVLALGYPEILYQGFDNVNNILFPSSGAAYAPGVLIQIVVMKVIATSICRGSGLQGGLYAPSIFIGAALGTAFGMMVHIVGDPVGLALSAPQAYALVGVAAMLASNCQVPLTSVLLLFELTRDYLIILPTLAAVGISFWVSSLAAPSVKNIAAARRMSAAAAAAAAVTTTQVNPAAAEAALVGSLQGRLAEPSCSIAGCTPSDGDAPAAPAELAAAAALSGSGMPVSCALERSCMLVEADMSVQRALELMQADDQHVAVVMSVDGSVMGLVTRDVLEQCVEAASQASSGSSSSGSWSGSLDSGSDDTSPRASATAGNGGSDTSVGEAAANGKSPGSL